tara:strand:- start:1875 stop:3632 length:1758 start_codon:yes stop_codon:yes gene_type:complete
MAFEYYRPDIPLPDKSQNPRLGNQENTRSNIGVGISLGYDNTTQSLTNIIDKENRAKRQYESTGESEVPEALYNDPDNNLAIEGVEWEPHMSFELLDEIRASKKIQKDFQENDSLSKYFGAFVGAALDPVNLIPVPFAKGGGVIKTAGKIAAFNMAVEGALTPVYKKAVEARQEELTFNDVAFNIGLAGILGGLMGGMGGAISKGANKVSELADASFGSGIPIKNKKILTTVADPINKNIAEKLTALLNQGSIRIDNILNTTNKIEGMDLAPSTTHFIDIEGTVGRTQPTLDNSFIRIDVDATGKINISGNTEMIAKLRQSLANIIPENNRVSATIGKDVIDYRTPKEMLDSLNIKIKEGDITIRGNQDGLDPIYQVQSVDGIIARVNERGEYTFFESIKNKDGSEKIGRKFTPEEQETIEKRILEFTVPSDEIKTSIRTKNVVPEENANLKNKANDDAETDSLIDATRNLDETESFVILNGIKNVSDEVADINNFNPSKRQLNKTAKIKAGKIATTTHSIDDLKKVGIDIDADGSLTVRQKPQNLTAEQIRLRDTMIKTLNKLERSETFNRSFFNTINCMKGKG